MTRRLTDLFSLLAIAALIIAGCSQGGCGGFLPQEASTGYLEISVTRDSKAYSLRSDPDTEFIRKESYGGMVAGRGHTVVFNDGRYVMTYTDRTGSPKQRFVKQLTEQDMRDLLITIAGSGLMDHDHSKAKIAAFRLPLAGQPAGYCSDCPTIAITFQLAEDNCPGRGTNAPITARAVYSSHIPSLPSHLPSYGEIPELVALHKISNYLSHFRRPGRVPRPD